MGRHKVVTALLVLLGLGLLGSLVPEEEPDPARASTTDEPGTTDRGSGTTSPGREPGRDVEGRRQRPAEGKRGGVDADDRSSGGTAPLAEPAPEAKPNPKHVQPLFIVTRVVDGDTIELGNGETVRLAGIDTPEVGECGYETATNDLADLVLGKRVRLAMSGEDRDSYGRLLRYVDVGRRDAGLQLIESGRAIAAYDSRDGYGFHPRQPVYIASDRGSVDLCPHMATGTPPKSRPAPGASKARPLTGGGGRSGGGSCARGYSPCLPVVADLDCPDVGGPVQVTGADPYRLDADGDGVGCDS
jgi:endonuclease YncB( thermonuclease family)